MLTPLPTCSLPIAMPRARSNERFHLSLSLQSERKIKIKQCQYPRRRSIDASGENSDKIRAIDAERGVFETETGEVADARNITATATVHPAHSSGDVDLLFERPVGNLHGK